MSNMSINWAQLKETADRANQVPPPGDYAVICRSAQWAQTKSGKPMIKAMYEIADGPCKGMTAWANQTLTTDNAVAVDIFLRYLSAHGIDPETASSNDQIVALMKDRTCEATVTHDTWQGRVQARLGNWRAHTGLTTGNAQRLDHPSADPTPMSPSDTIATPFNPIGADVAIPFDAE